MTTLNKYMYYILYCHWWLWSYEKFNSPLNKKNPRAYELRTIYNSLQQKVTALQSQAILMMQKCIEKDTQGIWSKRILGRDSPSSMVSLSQRAPSMYRPWEKQGQHHIKLSQCHIYIPVYNIARLYTNSRLCWIKEIPRTSEYFMSDFNLYLIKTSKLFTYLQIHVYIFYEL